MGSARSLRVIRISAQDARRVIRSLHYSGKVVQSSHVHLGIFFNGKCAGAAQFGPPLDKRRALLAVPGTPWDAMIELNRFALAEHLPRNSESRAIAVCVRLLRKWYPQLQWIQSYADATQCGDGTIYRAAGFDLVSIRRNTTMWRMPDGEVCADICFSAGATPNAGERSMKARYGHRGSEAAVAFLRRIGAVQLPGYQLRYIRFLTEDARARLALEPIPYSRIADIGAAMYRGERPLKREKQSIAATAYPAGEGGAIPTFALQAGASC